MPRGRNLGRAMKFALFRRREAVIINDRGYRFKRLRYLLRNIRVALPGVSPWFDQDIVLYHATLNIAVDSVLHQVDLRKCGDFNDFGRGFYTTTNRQQALSWATEKAVRSTRVKPALIRYTVERRSLADLYSLFFVRGDKNAYDYWSFVQHCRTTIGNHKGIYSDWYDIVAGPVTGSWKKQTVIPHSDQISFHTHRAIEILNICQKEREK